jgi:hypothetical protein
LPEEGATRAPLTAAKAFAEKRKPNFTGEEEAQSERMRALSREAGAPAKWVVLCRMRGC